MQKLDSKCIGLDFYGQPVGVNYRGDDTYKTRMGSLLSIFATVLIIAFAIKNGDKLINRASPSITVTQEVIDIANDGTSHNMKDGGVVYVQEITVNDVTNTKVESHDLDPRYARMAVWSQHLPSSEKERQPYLANGYMPEPSLKRDWHNCTKDEHMMSLPEDKREQLAEELQNAHCMDLSEAEISGGSNPKRNLTEKKVIAKLQYCDEYAAEMSEPCATPEEIDAYMNRVTLSAKIIDNYIDFSEPETENAIVGRIFDLGRIHISQWKGQNIIVEAKFKLMEATFYDEWFEFGLFTGGVGKEFIQYEDYSNFIIDTPRPFAVSVECKLSYKKSVAQRAVYNIFEFASDIGGLQGALDALFAIIMGMWTPLMFSRSFLRHNFKFNTNSESDETKKKKVSISQIGAKSDADEVNAKVQGLTARLRTTEKFQIQPAALDVILNKLSGIKPLSLSICHVVCTNWFSIFARCCLSRKSLKATEAFKRGQDSMDKHLDIRNLIRMSHDIRAFKELIWSPSQRFLFRKQARRVISLDEDSPTCSEYSDDTEYDTRTAVEARKNEILAWKFKSPIDRKLLLGIIDRDCQLGKKEDTVNELESVDQSELPNAEDVYRNGLKNPDGTMRNDKQRNTDSVQLTRLYGTKAYDSADSGDFEIQ